MFNRLGFPIATLLIFSGALFAQSNNPLSSEVTHSFDSVKKNLHAAAEKMPESDYSFKPTPQVRSFGEVVGHVVMAQAHACGALAGAATGSTPKLGSKNEILAELDQSSSLCDKAFASLTDSNATEMVKTPRGQVTRLGALVGVLTHDTEQYAILGVYMRLKGMVPPSSEHRSGGK